ncbi:MAG: hypothetical protein Q4A75_08940 [Peptostreptococcaceae bacterium]|nr:hypothetical protein [Peptostreptococcaceae bacterium]
MNVRLQKFKEHFNGFENQYIIIGGTACELIMENEEIPFRATKDLDIVLIIETLTNEFAERFWQYIKEANYQHMNKSTGKTQFYRFVSPKSKDHPFMIEIFSRKPEGIVLNEDAVLTPLPFDEEISSLSAILIDEAYYELLKSGHSLLDGIPILDEYTLIPFKAKAWLDLQDRKERGESVDGKNIKKHKNDVFRLAQLLTPNTRKELSNAIKEDMKLFLSAMEKEDIDLKALNLRNLSKENIIQLLLFCYGIEK